MRMAVQLGNWPDWIIPNEKVVMKKEKYYLVHETMCEFVLVFFV